jgi:hypothetical protein
MEMWHCPSCLAPGPGKPSICTHSIKWMLMYFKKDLNKAIQSSYHSSSGLEKNGKGQPLKNGKTNLSMLI